MEVLLVIAILGATSFPVSIFWVQYMVEIIGEMQFTRIAKKSTVVQSNGSLQKSHEPVRHLGKFLLISELVFLFFSCVVLVTSIFSRVPLSLYGIVGVVAFNVLTGFSFGLFIWICSVIGVSNDAFWPPSYEEKRAGKKFFWRPKRYCNLCLEEKAHLRKITSWRGLTISVVRGYLILFLGIAFLILYLKVTNALISSGGADPDPSEMPTPAIAERNALIMAVGLVSMATVIGFFPWLIDKMRARRFLKEDPNS